MDIVAFSTRRRVTIAMAMFTLFLFGAISWFALKVNLLPDLSYPTLTIRTEYTGAAPSELETLITEPVEESVGVVKGLRKLRSVSRPGQSDVVLEFAWGTDMDQASIEVREKLENVRLPLDVQQPVLLRFNPSTEPVMRLVLTPPVSSSAAKGAVLGEAELIDLRRYAEDELKKRLETVDGVAAVKIGGGLEDEIQVQLDEQKLAQLNLTAAKVIERLSQENINVAGGRIAEGNQRYLVRTVNQFSDLDQMRELLITIQNGVPIRLRDVASVVQGYQEREAIIRLRGSEAVELAIYKEGDANAVQVADAVRTRLDQLQMAGQPKTGRGGPPGGKPAVQQAEAQPQEKGSYAIDGYQLRTIEDTSVFIENAINEVGKEAVLGGILAILIIFVFLRDGWSTFVIFLSLPISIVTTFFFMDQLDLSLNVMSLAGLALATGMVVDDSIVVLESIAKARERGLGIIEAAIRGTNEVKMAVVASTLTTVAVFFPLVFVQGVAGQLFKDQALTVSIALMVSLVVSLTLIPMLSSIKAKAPMAFADESSPSNGSFVGRTGAWMQRARPRWLFATMLRVFRLVAVGASAIFNFLWRTTRLGKLVSIVFGFFTRLFLKWIPAAMHWLGAMAIRPYDWAAKSYHALLPKALLNPVLVLGSAATAFLLSLALVPLLGADLIPQLAQDRFEMTARLAPGTPLAKTDTLVTRVQDAHQGDTGVREIYGVSGTGTRLDASPTESGENIAKVSVVMDNYSPEGEAALVERMRKTLAREPGVDVKFGRPQLLSFSTPLEIEVRGPDLPTIERAARKLQQLLEGSTHFADVKSTVQDGFPELQIIFDQERIAQLGLTERQVTDQVVRQVRGEVATRYSFRDRKIDVRVRAQESDRASVEDIRNLSVNPQSAVPVTLGSVAEVRETIGPNEINRIEQDRVAVVSANLRNIDLGGAVKEVRKLVDDQPLGAEVRLLFGGQSEELEASRTSLIFAFTLAIFLVYLVMASQFESLLHPFVILFSIPLAMVGAILALFLNGSPISVVVFIGLILLVGIVVKNAIVLIDKVNQLREEGVAKRDALCQAAESRLRPIIMTTLTTLFGFAPLAFVGGEGAEVRQPMAITVIGGLVVSTLLTLIVIPVVYDLMDRRGDAWYRERGERAARSRKASEAQADEQLMGGANA